MVATRRILVLSGTVILGLGGLMYSGEPNRFTFTAAKVYPFGRGAVKWVSTTWMHEYLHDPNVRIIDVQPDIEDYFVGHIEGAVYLNDATVRAPRDGIPVQSVPSDVARLLFRQAGIDNDVPVVVYSSKGAFGGAGNGLGQSMMAYTLARFGHNKVYVLDGGLDKWKQEGKPLTQAFPRVGQGKFRPMIHDEYFIDMADVKKLKDQKGVLLLDARPQKLYEGAGPWIKKGHIPGAVNLPWMSLMTDNNPALVKSDEELRRILKEHDVTPDKMIILYCGTGREATDEFLVLKWYLGYPDVRLYEGSFTEWTAYPENPTVVGSSPR